MKDFDISHTSLQQLTEITKKSFRQSVQKRWREGKRKEEKKLEWQLQSFLRYTQTQKC